MSYILDALRKSERERALGNVRTLEPVPPASVVSGRGRVLRWTVFILVLIAVAAALGWAFADRLAATMARLESGTESDSPPPSDRADVARSSGPVLPAPDPVPRAQPVTPVSNPSNAPATAPPAVIPAPELPVVAGPTEPVAASVLSPNEAPTAVRDAIGRLFLSVVSYSRDPQRRFVLINQVFYREGDKLPGGVKLRRIEPDGVVVEYRGSEVLLKP